MLLLILGPFAFIEGLFLLSPAIALFLIAQSLILEPEKSLLDLLRRPIVLSRLWATLFVLAATAVGYATTLWLAHY